MIQPFSSTVFCDHHKTFKTPAKSRSKFVCHFYTEILQRSQKQDRKTPQKAASPERASLVFLQALAEAGHGPASCAGSLRFVAGILGHQRWIDHFADPVVKAWCSSNTRKVAKKEALPLPLHVVADLEASVCSDVVSGMSADTMLVCGFLIMIWGSLRFSDAQRIDVAGLTLEKMVCSEGNAGAQSLPLVECHSVY